MEKYVKSMMIVVLTVACSKNVKKPWTIPEQAWLMDEEAQLVLLRMLEMTEEHYHELVEL